jgi:hypothetical protein
MLADDPVNGTMFRALKSLFTRHVAEEVPSVLHSHAPAQSAVSHLPPTSQPPQPQPEPDTPDEIIQRFEPFLVHGPRNVKVLETLAKAYARKMMLDQSLSLYGRALEVMGGKNTAIEAAIEETTLKKLDLELSQVDPEAPDQADQCERIQNRRLEYQWHTMEEPR